MALPCRHKLFTAMVTQSCEAPAPPASSAAPQMRPPSLPADLPVFGAVHPCA